MQRWSPNYLSSLLRGTCGSNSLKKGWQMRKHPSLPFIHNFIQCAKGGEGAKGKSTRISWLSRSTVLSLISCICYYLWIQGERIMSPILDTSSPLWGSAWLPHELQEGLYLLHLSHLCTSLLPCVTNSNRMASLVSSVQHSQRQDLLACAGSISLTSAWGTWGLIWTSVLPVVARHSVSLSFSLLYFFLIFYLFIWEREHTSQGEEEREREF